MLYFTTVEPTRNLLTKKYQLPERAVGRRLLQTIGQINHVQIDHLRIGYLDYVHIDHLDHLDPDLPLGHAVQDLYSTEATQETSPRSSRL